MVIGLLTIASIPTVIGVAEGVSEQRRQNQQKVDPKRMEKFYMDVRCEGGRNETDLGGQRIVLKDGKAYVDDPDPSLRALEPSRPAEAFYVTYPETEQTRVHPRGLGLVSTVSDDPPMLNWIYADKDTHEVKYGNRTQSIAHVVGPWDWANDEIGVILEGKDRFVAVEEDGKWAVYFDRDSDGCQKVLTARGLGRKKVVDIQVSRKMLEVGSAAA